MKKLKYKLENLEGVDPALHALYVQQQDGSFLLSVDGLEPTAPTADDKSATMAAQLQQLQQQLNDANQALSANEAAKAEAEAQAQEKALANLKSKGDIEALGKSWAEKHQKVLDDAAAEKERLQGGINKLVVESTANQLAEGLAIKGSAAVLAPHILSRLTAVERNGGWECGVLDAAGQPSALTLDELKAEIEGNAAFAPVLHASSATGGGAMPSAAVQAAPAGDISSMTMDQKIQHLDQKHGEIS